MKKKNTLLIIVAVVIVVVVVCFVASRPKLQKGVIDVWLPDYVFVSDPDETVSFDTSDFFDITRKPREPRRIDTFEEFEQKVTIDDSAKSQRKYKKYNESFFEENSLIIYHFQTATSSTGFKIKKAYCDNQTFIVVLEDMTPPGSMVCMAFTDYYVIVEVKDELIADCTKFVLE